MECTYTNHVMVMWCIEKRKVTRRLKSLTNQLKRATDEERWALIRVWIFECIVLFRESLLSEMSKLRGDLNYITVCYHFYVWYYISLSPFLKHFPYGQKYLALYPTSETSNKSLQLRGIIIIIIIIFTILDQF